MESDWTLSHFLFEITVGILGILISAYIGWRVWETQLKVTTDDEAKKKLKEDNDRLQTLLMQCVLTATDNRKFLEEAQRRQKYSAAPYEVKSWIAGLMFALKYDSISNLLNSGLDEKLPESIQRILADTRLDILELQKDLVESDKRFDFYAVNQTFGSNSNAEWDNLKREFEECIVHLKKLEESFTKKAGIIQVANQTAK